MSAGVHTGYHVVAAHTRRRKRSKQDEPERHIDEAGKGVWRRRRKKNRTERKRGR